MKILNKMESWVNKLDTKLFGKKEENYQPYAGKCFPDFITFFNFSYKPALQVSVAAFFSLIWVTHGNFVSSCYVCA